MGSSFLLPPTSWAGMAPPASWAGMAPPGQVWRLLPASCLKEDPYDNFDEGLVLCWEIIAYELVRI